MGCWEFLERNLPHSDPASDPGSGKVPPGKPGGVGSQALGGSLKANTDPGSCLPRVEPPHIHGHGHRDGTTQDAGAHQGSGSPSALGNFIPLYPRVPDPRDGGVLARQSDGESWLGSHGIQHGRNPGEPGLFSLEKRGLRRLHIPAGGMEQGQEPPGVRELLLREIKDFWLICRRLQDEETKIQPSLTRGGQADDPWDFFSLSPTRFCRRSRFSSFPLLGKG